MVTHVAQVIPKHTLRLVQRWWRQLRRAFKASARGAHSLARRLVPEDLWLPHAEHSVAETAAWNWDLRPLLSGKPAVPLPTSGVDGVQPLTGVNVRAVADALAAGGFADEAILSELCFGIGDDSRCQRGTLLCAPHAGALRELELAAGKAESDVAAGWASGGYTTLPCWPLRTCPYSLVDESERAGRPKHRLTIDLSWPHAGKMRSGDGWVDSVNGAMDRNAWPENKLVRVSQFAEALGLLRGPPEAQRAVRTWGFDCSAYYRAVGRQRAELWRNGVFLPSGVRLDERCCFGDASAATKCARVSNFLAHRVRQKLREFDAAHPTRDASWLAWQAARRAAAAAAGAQDDWAELFWFALYIDDGFAGSASDLVFDGSGQPVCGADGRQVRRDTVHFDLARGVLAEFGWESAPSKEQPPGEELETLGVLVSLTGGGRVRLSAAKRSRYSARAEKALLAGELSHADAQALVGRLQFAAQVYPVGRQRLHAAWRLVNATSRRRDGVVPLGEAVRAELEWWVAELRRPEHDGVPLVACTVVPPVGLGASAVYADASDTGAAAWAVEDGTLFLTAAEWSEEEAATLTIAERELAASTWGLVALAPHLERYVVSFTDNTVAQSALRSLTPRSVAAQRLTVQRAEWLLRHGVVEEARRVTTSANLWADVGSRPELGGPSEVARQARCLGLRVQWVPVPSEWRAAVAALTAH